MHPDIPKGGNKKQAIEILRQHIEYGLNLIDKKMFLLIENMPNKKYGFYSPGEMKKFIDLINHKQFGATWDIGHAKLAIGNRYLEFPRVLKSSIKECHFSDVKKKRNKLTDHYPLGSGIFNYKKIIKELKKIGFDGLIVMEIMPKEASGIEISRKVLEKAIREA